MLTILLKCKALRQRQELQDVRTKKMPLEDPKLMLVQVEADWNSCVAQNARTKHPKRNNNQRATGICKALSRATAKERVLLWEDELIGNASEGSPTIMRLQLIYKKRR